MAIWDKFKDAKKRLFDGIDALDDRARDADVSAEARRHTIDAPGPRELTGGLEELELLDAAATSEPSKGDVSFTQEEVTEITELPLDLFEEADDEVTVGEFLVDDELMSQAEAELDAERRGRGADCRRGGRGRRRRVRDRCGMSFFFLSFFLRCVIDPTCIHLPRRERTRKERKRKNVILLKEKRNRASFRPPPEKAKRLSFYKSSCPLLEEVKTVPRSLFFSFFCQSPPGTFSLASHRSKNGPLFITKKKKKKKVSQTHFLF